MARYLQQDIVEGFENAVALADLRQVFDLVLLKLIVHPVDAFRYAGPLTGGLGKAQYVSKQKRPS